MKRELFFIMGIAVVFGILLSYPISVASGVIIFLAGEFDMTAATKSLVVCLVIIGAMCGILGGGFIADSYGRKKAIFLAAVFLFVGSLFSVMSKAFPELLFFRFLVGVGIGITSMVVPIYLAEMALPRYRGKMVSLFQVAITLGILFSYLTNLCLFKMQSWRIALGISAVFAFLALLLIYYIPESPIWLESKLQVEQRKVSIKKLFSGGLKKALIIGVLLSVFQQITGINAIIYYAPEIFHHAGITNLCNKLIATSLLGVLNVLTALFTMTQIDGWGRRKLLLIGIPGMIGSLLLLAGFFFNSFFAIGGLVLYIIFFGISLGPVVWVLTAEIFPLEIRGKAVALSLFANWLASLVVAWPFLFLVEWIGIDGTFYIFSLTSIIALLFVYFFVPETKGKTLEEIQEYWQN